MLEKEKEAIKWINSVRTSCRIAGPSNLPLTGAEQDSLREAIVVIQELIARCEEVEKAES